MGALAGAIALASVVPGPAIEAAEGTPAAMLRPDFNGDGFDDLALGAPSDTIGKATAAGSVTVIYGSTGGLASAGAERWHQNTNGVADEAENSDFFGASLAAGDYDGDGFADLAVGAPFEDSPGDPDDESPAEDVGMVHVLYGSPGGLQAADGEFLAGGGGQYLYGRALAAFDGLVPGAGGSRDDLADLAIGAPGSESGAGSVELNAGFTDGIGDSSFLTFPQPGPAGSRMGSSLAAGDFDGDGSDTVVAGLPNYSVESPNAGGVVTVSPMGPVITQNTGDVQNTAESGDFMGSTVAAGDFDADGKDDLAVGSPGETLGSTPQTRAGLITILYGTVNGPAARNSDQFSQSPDQVGDVAEAGDEFGSSLIAANFGRGGPADLAVGVQGEGLGKAGAAGVVHVLYGSPGGLADDSAQIWHQNRPGFNDVSEQGDSLGFSLGAGRFGKGGKADLALGAPGENLGDIVNSGAVAVLYSTKSGLSVEGDQYWHANRPGIPGEAREHAAFGRTLYSSGEAPAE